MNNDNIQIVIHRTTSTYWTNVMFNDELMFCHSTTDWDELVREIKRLGPFLFDTPLPPEQAPHDVE